MNDGNAAGLLIIRPCTNLSGFGLSPDLLKSSPAFSRSKKRLEIVGLPAWSKADAGGRAVINEARERDQAAPACQRPRIVVAALNLVPGVVPRSVITIVDSTD